MVEGIGRHERTRTADPYRVKVVLYQLSYVPKDKTRSRIVYFGEEAKVTKAESHVKLTRDLNEYGNARKPGHADSPRVEAEWAPGAVTQVQYGW